jgi:hypothetical protein
MLLSVEVILSWLFPNATQSKQTPSKTFGCRFKRETRNKSDENTFFDAFLHLFSKCKPICTRYCFV